MDLKKHVRLCIDVTLSTAVEATLRAFIPVTINLPRNFEAYNYELPQLLGTYSHGYSIIKYTLKDYLS
jgi:hypothetical protein